MIFSILRRTALTQLIIQFLGFISQLLIVAALEPEDYKLYVLLALTLSLYSAVDNPITFSLLSKEKTQDATRLKLFLTSASIAFIVMTIYTLTMTDFSTLLMTCLLIALTASISSKYCEIELIRNQKYKTILLANLYTRLFFAISIIFGVYTLSDSQIIAYLAISIQLITSIVYLIFVARGVKDNSKTREQTEGSIHLRIDTNHSATRKFIILFCVSVAFKIIYLQFASMSENKVVLFYLIALDAVFNVLMLTYKFSFSLPQLQIKAMHFGLFTLTSISTSIVFLVITGVVFDLTDSVSIQYTMLITLTKTAETIINVFLREKL